MSVRRCRHCGQVIVRAPRPNTTTGPYYPERRKKWESLMDSLSEEERRDFFKGDLFAGVAASQTTIGPGRLTTRLGFTHLRSNLPHGNQDDGSQRRLREALERRA